MTSFPPTGCGKSGCWKRSWRIQGINPRCETRIADYAKLFWANRGNHNDMTSQKFLPGLTFEELRLAALSAQHNGAFKRLC